MCPQPVILNSMPFVIVCFSLSFTMMLSAFPEPNNLRDAYMQYFDMEFRIPDNRPLFDKTIPFTQSWFFIFLCHHVCLCLYQRGKSAKDTTLHIAI